jgi:hypothetical protein
MMATTHHHVTARWVEEYQGAVEIRHHLKEVWADEDEPTVTTSQDGAS